jgi:hypothetical protein
MQRGLIGIAAVVALQLGAPAAFGQKMTEQFIPMGQSPGLSGMYTDVGQIEQIDFESRTITLAEVAGGRVVAITGRTRIWLDRSTLQQTNVTGSFMDLREGRRVEVKYEDDARRQAAAWIKVDAAPE